MNSGAGAQKLPGATCPAVQDMKADQLFGLWEVHFSNPPTGLPATATLLLERHAEFADSLAGIVSRDLGDAAGLEKLGGHAAKAALAGDLEDGLLLLDESSDNLSISGTWNAEMMPGSCGKAFEGKWKDTSSNAIATSPDVPFLLRKLP